MRLWLVITVMVWFAACTNGDRQKKVSEEAKGQIRKEHYGEQNQYSYVVYTPATYSDEKAFPLVLALDAHGRGRKAVKLFRRAMKASPNIVVGLNNFSNESNQPIPVIHKALQAVLQHYKIDEARISLFGFSGGARMAGLYASANAQVKGVFAASASFDVSSKLKSREEFHAYLTAGKQDFNYTKMRKLSRELSGKSIPRQFTAFQGGHEYPPPRIACEMMLWELFKAARNGRANPPRQIIRKFTDRSIRKADSLMQTESYFSAYKVLSKCINFLEGLHIPRKILNKYQKVADYKQIKERLKLRKKLERFEQQMQMEYNKALHNKNINWWSKQIEDLEKKIQSAHGHRKDTYMRLKHFLSMVFFTETRKAITGDLYKAGHFLHLYGMVAPENPDYLFFKAKFAAKEGDSANAADYLRQSLQKGFLHERWILRDSILRQLYRQVDSIPKMRNRSDK